MTQVSTYDGAAAVADAPAVAATGPARSFTLRRTGKRPLTFHGSELCMAMSFEVGTPLWYEINVFRRSDADGFIVDVRMFTKSDGEKDYFTVRECANFEEVMHYLEGYEPANDVRVDVTFDDDDLTLADLTVQALGLKIKVEEARRQYHGLVGQILYELDA